MPIELLLALRRQNAMMLRHMARVKLFEFAVKRLIHGNTYKGLHIGANTNLEVAIDSLTDQPHVVKVDQGVKKRAKKGLLHLNVKKQNIADACRELSSKGYERFLIEPMVSHEAADEQYLSITNTREGVTVLYSKVGGVNIEDNASTVTEVTIRPYEPWTKAFGQLPLAIEDVKKLEALYKSGHFTMLELNPFIFDGEHLLALDAAGAVDDAAINQQNLWTKEDIVVAEKSETELDIAELNDHSRASLSYILLNKGGAVFTLLSGGGASLAITDVFTEQYELLGNYGEYSGDPTEEETYQYSRAILRDLLASPAPKKAIVIAGGVANFTNIANTFEGLIRAIDEVAGQLTSQRVKVFVRRGGPYESEGLEKMQQFLTKHNLNGEVLGSEAPLEKAARSGITYVTS